MPSEIEQINEKFEEIRQEETIAFASVVGKFFKDKMCEVSLNQEYESISYVDFHNQNISARSLHICPLQ